MKSSRRFTLQIVPPCLSFVMLNGPSEAKQTRCTRTHTRIHTHVHMDCRWVIALTHWGRMSCLLAIVELSLWACHVLSLQWQQQFGKNELFTTFGVDFFKICFWGFIFSPSPSGCWDSTGGLNKRYNVNRLKSIPLMRLLDVLTPTEAAMKISLLIYSDEVTNSRKKTQTRGHLA